jgi:Tol biopolymer transport system component
MTTFVGTLGIVALGALAACSSDSTSPNPLDQIPDFVYVSNQNGNDQLFTYSKGATALLPGSVAGDADPQSAHGRIVFTSFRDNSTSSEIYSANNDGSDIRRLTNNPALDFQPSLSPDGTRIVFASLRTGTSRLWIMGADGSNPTAVATGSSQYTPESVPRFSPDGTRILFDSPRTNTSQLYVMPAAGGAATQLTHETNGAFDGSWSADGSSVFYIDGRDHTVIHEVDVSAGTVTEYVTGGVDVGQPACTGALCLVVSGRTSGPGDIYAYIGSGAQQPLLVLGGSGNERQPAFLVP